MEEKTRAWWAQQFEAAAHEYFALNTDVEGHDFYRCRVEPCERHGDGCLTVICGEVLEHVQWKKVAPSPFAEELLTRTVPRKAEE